MSDAGESPRAHPPHTVLYGPAIHEARASGDVQRMREMEQRAQQYLDSVDDVRSALAELRRELGGT